MDIEVHKSFVLEVNHEYVQLLLQRFCIRLELNLQSTHLCLSFLDYTAMLLSEPITSFLGSLFDSALQSLDFSPELNV